MPVLVAYASRHGATQGIAERIAETLRSEGLDAEARAGGVGQVARRLRRVRDRERRLHVPLAQGRREPGPSERAAAAGPAGLALQQRADRGPDRCARDATSAPHRCPRRSASSRPPSTPATITSSSGRTRSIASRSASPNDWRRHSCRACRRRPGMPCRRATSGIGPRSRDGHAGLPTISGRRRQDRRPRRGRVVTAPVAPTDRPLPYGPLMTRLLPELQRGFRYAEPLCCGAASRGRPRAAVQYAADGLAHGAPHPGADPRGCGGTRRSATSSSTVTCTARPGSGTGRSGSGTSRPTHACRSSCRRSP